MSTHAAPASAKSVFIDKQGGVDVLQIKPDFPVAQPQEGQLLVKNDFIGVNYLDTYLRSGVYPVSNFPYVPGYENAGTVVATGGGDTYGLKVGDRVCSIAKSTYAEYNTVPAIHTHKLPDGVSTQTGAAALLQGLTAMTLIREAHEVKKGDWILVPAAAGGVGLWLCQLLKAVGARTIGTASCAEKREAATKAGAEVVLEYADTIGEDAFVDKIKEITGGNGCRAVFDGVGKATFDSSLRCVARKGTMVSFGNASGLVPEFNIQRLKNENIKLIRTNLYRYIVTREEFEENAVELFELIQRNNIDVAIHQIYSLDDVAQAHTDIESRKTMGKLLLKV